VLNVTTSASNYDKIYRAIERALYPNRQPVLADAAVARAAYAACRVLTDERSSDDADRGSQSVTKGRETANS